MAKPVIGMIATPQNFVVNTDFTLTVTITGIDTSAGDTVKVLGLLERFAYALRQHHANHHRQTDTPVVERAFEDRHDQQRRSHE